MQVLLMINENLLFYTILESVVCKKLWSITLIYS